MRWVILSISMLPVVGCFRATDDTVNCTPGTPQSCICASQLMGAQVCNSAGDGYEDCICASPPDTGMAPDLMMSAAPDLAMGADLSPQGDLSPQADLSQPMDPCSNQVLDGNETDVDCGGGTCPACADGKMCLHGSDCVGGTCTNNLCEAKPIAPSHVAFGDYKPNAAALPSSVAIIDTSNLVLKDFNGNNIAVPANGAFAVEAGNAVLSVGAWTVTAPVTVVGSRSLVIVAAGAVVVSAPVRASAVGAAPGPGGAGPAMGTGMGHPGTITGFMQGSWCGGGGGGGFATFGAQGGTGTFVDGLGTHYVAQGGGGGIAYPGQLNDFLAGSGGGNGAVGSNQGGAGGGALQITSAVSIDVKASGLVAASGGGGTGGNHQQFFSDGGGGGGSGGTVFLEAPAITVAGGLFANGGAGGDPTLQNPGAAPDGTESTIPANGGAHAGNGGAGGIAPTTPADAGEASSGGGGGSVWQIWLRTRNVAAQVTGLMSPTAMTDTTL